MRLLNMIQSWFRRKPPHDPEQRKDWEKRELIDRTRLLNARLRALDAEVSVSSGRDYRGRVWEKS